MPLPLPNLDTRRWSDLVAEGIANVPRYAPSWTDHNIHEVGITLLELLAWAIEQGFYRVDRVPDRHRLKFLHLIGFAPRPPQAATVALTLDPAGAGITVPAGSEFLASGTVPFRLVADAPLADASLVRLASGSAQGVQEQTQRWRDGEPLLIFGPDPQTGNWFELGFDDALPTGQEIALWFWDVEAAGDEAERQRLLAERARQEAACAPIRPAGWLCAEPAQEEGEAEAPALPAHHSVRLEWRIFDGSGWQVAEVVADDTRALTLSGQLHLRLATPMQPVAAGEPFPLRCVLVGGRYDAAPVLADVALNTVAARQEHPHDAVLLGSSTGVPGQQLALPEAPVAGGQATVTVGGNAWRQRPDFDASKRTASDFVLDAASGTIHFGDGERGRVPAAGAPIRATYIATQGAAGNVSTGVTWTIPDAALAAQVTVGNRHPATGGEEAETLAAAQGRAAAALWAHERLVALLPPGVATFDQLSPETVLALPQPERATTLVDYERLARSVPGTHIARVRAWSGIDPAYPGVQAPGTVTVVVVPYLPQGRPLPSPGLLATVRAYLDRRRTLGTRLLVVGPAYRTVQAVATVRTRSGADLARVRQDIEAALNLFLDPLEGGPAGRGWPFGRDVYRSEILQQIDNVPGVDHVLSLELVVDNCPPQCGNICLSPTDLVSPGAHQIEVQGP